jgi:hypothetical protein
MGPSSPTSGRASSAQKSPRHSSTSSFAATYRAGTWTRSGSSSICLLAETCAILGDTGCAAPLYELLLPWSRLNAVAVPELALDSVSRPLGILATLLDRFGDAERHFEDAMRMNERMWARPWIAEAQADHAHMLLRRNARRDRERAGELLSRAQATRAQLGMSSDPSKASALARTEHAPS